MGIEDNKLTDEELLFKCMKFCNTHRSSIFGCCKCPLYHKVCITSKGNIALNSVDTNFMNFVKFTDEFRNMIDIVMNNKTTL